MAEIFIGHHEVHYTPQQRESFGAVVVDWAWSLDQSSRSASAAPAGFFREENAEGGVIVYS